MKIRTSGKMLLESHQKISRDIKHMDINHLHVRHVEKALNRAFFENGEEASNGHGIMASWHHGIMAWSSEFPVRLHCIAYSHLVRHGDAMRCHDATKPRSLVVQVLRMEMTEMMEIQWLH